VEQKYAIQKKSQLVLTGGCYDSTELNKGKKKRVESRSSAAACCNGCTDVIAFDQNDVVQPENILRRW